MTILEKQNLLMNDIIDNMLAPQNVDVIRYAIEMYVGGFLVSEIDDEIKARDLI